MCTSDGTAVGIAVCVSICELQTEVNGIHGVCTIQALIGGTVLGSVCVLGGDIDEKNMIS